MGRTSAIPASEEGKAGLFETMLKFSTEQRLYVLTPWLVSPSQLMPDREELIAAFMSIATYTPTMDARGHSVFGAAHWPTREEAERAVDRCESRRPHFGGASLIQSSNGVDSQHALDLRAS